MAADITTWVSQLTTRQLAFALALLFGCSLIATRVSATEMLATPGPQRAQSGVLQPQSVVHAIPSAPTPAPQSDQASSGGPTPTESKIWKPHPTGGNQGTTPDVSAFLGAPLPDPLDNPVPPPGDPRRLSLFRNTTVPVTTGMTGAVSEPSTDQSGQNIFATANYHAEFSTDNGRTWQGLNPYTIFGEDLGFCCDQATVYDPAHNRQHWVLQYLPSQEGPPGAIDHLTLANSAGGDFVNWCPYTIALSALGRSSDESFDYNDLVVGTHYLYLTTRIISFPSNSDSEEDYTVDAVALLRISLDDLAACQPAHFDFVVRTDIGEDEYGELRVAQGITDVAYAGANYPKGGLGRFLRLLVWPEASQFVTTIDRPVPPYIFFYHNPEIPGGGIPNCASEDGVVGNWCYINPILSATRGGGYLYFSWDAQQYGDKRPFPYTRITQVQESSLAVVGSGDLYGLTVAHALAQLVADRRGDIGLVDNFGGGKGSRHYFPGGMVGIMDHSRMTPPLVDFFLFGHGVGCYIGEAPANGTDFQGDWGDFNTIRDWQGVNGLWLATTYIRNDNTFDACPHIGASVTIKNIVFGRELDRANYVRFLSGDMVR